MARLRATPKAKVAASDYGKHSRGDIIQYNGQRLEIIGAVATGKDLLWGWPPNTPREDMDRVLIKVKDIVE